jgi:hypothetical protein
MRWLLLLMIVGCTPAIAERRVADTLTVERFKDTPLLAPDQGKKWRAVHAGMCCALPWDDGFRVWYTGREGGNNPYQIYRADFDDNWNVIGEDSEPAIPANGEFDRAGAFMPCVVEVDGHLRMYYAAHKEGEFPGPGSSAMFAESFDGGITWIKQGHTLTAEGDDDHGVGTHCVFRDDEKWRMIYTHVEGVRPKMRYFMKYAVSDDGKRWHRPLDNTAIDFDGGTSARPCVWWEGDRWLMVYTHNEKYRPESGRGPKTYRIRWADSQDGMRFADRGELLDISERGWDSQMVCYGWAVPDRGLMFYTGNEWGKGGFGVVKLHRSF